MHTTSLREMCKHFNSFFLSGRNRRNPVIMRIIIIFTKINIILMENVMTGLKNKCKNNDYWKFKGVSKDHKVILKEPSWKEQLKQVALSIMAADRKSPCIQDLNYTYCLHFITWFMPSVWVFSIWPFGMNLSDLAKDHSGQRSSKAGSKWPCSINMLQ